MVERLRRALDELEPPLCPTCTIEMQWTRSALVTEDSISHLFLCPNCHRTGRTASKVQKPHLPPAKLSAPAAIKLVA